VSCKAMYELAKRTSRDFGQMEIVRSNPLTARVVLHASKRPLQTSSALTV